MHRSKFFFCKLINCQGYPVKILTHGNVQNIFFEKKANNRS